MNDTDSHQIGRVLSFEKVEHFVFQIFVGFRVDVKCLPGPSGEVAEGMPGVGRGSLHLQQGQGFSCKARKRRGKKPM